MAEKDPEEMIFPITRDDCPGCGCKERLGRKTIDRLIAKGILSKGIFPDGLQWQIPLVDQKRITTLLTPTVKVPIITISFDVCADCLTVYCTKFNLEIKDMPVQVQQVGPGGGQGFSPS